MGTGILLVASLLSAGCDKGVQVGGPDGGQPSTSTSTSTSATTGTTTSTSGTNGAGGTIGSTNSSGTTATTSNPTTSTGSSTGSTTGSANNLIGTWDLTTTPIGDTPVATTVVVGQDQLTITSPGWSLTAQRTSDTLSFDDIFGPSSGAVLTATQTAATFNAGIIPFNLGGTWAIQGGPSGGASTITCTLQVSGEEIDATCNNVSPSSLWFSFTTAKGPSATSGFGDFGGTWTNTWTWGGSSTTTYPCELDFSGNDINTCDGGAVNGAVVGSPLAGITFTWDGANTVSGSAQGWAEFSATRR
jgi:hypothetical protein